MVKIIRKDRVGIILMLIAILASLVSQNPFFIENGSYQWLKFTWGFPIAYYILVSPIVFFSRRNLTFFTFILLFFTYSLFCEAITSNDYLGDDLVNIIMSSLICVTSYVFWYNNQNERLLRDLCWLVLIGGVFLSWIVYSKYLIGADLTMGYAYGPKNSLSTILLCCAVIALLNYKPQQLILKIIYYGLSIYVLFVILFLRSRATFLGAFFILFYMIFKSDKKKLKLLLVGLVALSILLIVLNKDVYDLIVLIFMGTTEDVSDLDSLSSGRTFIIADAVNSIKEHPFIGIGNRYIESMPIAMVAQYGILGAPIVFLFLLYLYWEAYKKDKQNTVSLTGYLLLVAFLINSIFEAQAPFGPGAKSFLMWMFLGFAYAMPSSKKSHGKSMERVLDC